MDSHPERIQHRLRVLSSHITPATCMSQRSSLPKNVPMRVKKEVADAMASGKAVVALESTIISHGMPYPRNVETALAVEDIIKQQGAEPATIAILDGVVCIGLTESEVDRLGKLGQSVRKTSRRDIGLVLASKGNGATTVSGTMVLASMAGVRIFVTGGIGGVHRGVEETMDVSADLTELGRTPVAVICAGVKSILDIPRTLEYLETQGVPVISYQTSEFPAFYTPNSGQKGPIRLDSAEDCAKLIHSNNSLNLSNGVVVGVPIPSDKAAASKEIENAIQTSLRETREKKIIGRDVTPYILARVAELTQGRSLDANIALVKNNARVGASIAVHYARLQKAQVAHQPKSALSFSGSNVVVVGGVNMDYVCRPLPGQHLVLGTSNRGQLVREWGGVGRNIAECVYRLGCRPFLISAVGDDATGDDFYKVWGGHFGLNTSGVVRQPKGTASYIAQMKGDGDLLAATIANDDIFDLVDSSLLSQFKTEVGNASIVVVDANVSEAAIKEVVAMCASLNVEVLFEPTSIEKALRIVPGIRGLTYMTPNMDELRAISEKLDGGASHSFGNWEEAVKHHSRVAIGAGVKCVLTTLGELGVYLALSNGGDVLFSHFLPPPVKIVNTNGAGDSFVGGFVVGRSRSLSVDDSIQLGMRAAKATLESGTSVFKGSIL